MLEALTTTFQRILGIEPPERNVVAEVREEMRTMKVEALSQSEIRTVLVEVQPTSADDLLLVGAAISGDTEVLLSTVKYLDLIHSQRVE